MRRFLITLCCLLGLTGCATTTDFKVVYSGLNFYIPDQVVAVGSAGGDDNFLGFKYSKRPGERFIAFSKENGLGTGGCDYPTFFQQVLKLTDSKTCELSAVASFRTVFDVGSRSGVWRDGKHEVYYFPGDNGKIFAFLVLDDQNIVRIDSDFLDTKAMKAVLAEQLKR